MSRIDIIGQNGNEGLHYMERYKERAKELADAHWHYVRGVLEASNVPLQDIECIEFHYKASGEHFYKHAIEDVQEGYYATK